MHSSRNIITRIYLFYRDIVRIDVSISNIFGKDIIFSIIYNIDSYVTQASLLFGRDDDRLFLEIFPLGGETFSEG